MEYNTLTTIYTVTLMGDRHAISGVAFWTERQAQRFADHMAEAYPDTSREDYEIKTLVIGNIRDLFIEILAGMGLRPEPVLDFIMNDPNPAQSPGEELLRACLTWMPGYDPIIDAVKIINDPELRNSLPVRFASIEGDVEVYLLGDKVRGQVDSLTTSNKDTR